jgi:molybdopterin synthase catalytic subunit
MSYQNREIQRAHDSLASKTRGAVVVMIGEIRNQKERRGEHCAHLTIPVGLNTTETNEPETCQQQKSARSVQEGIEMGKKWNEFRHLIRRCNDE